MMPQKGIFPPRPKGRMIAGLLPEYESSGEWVAQRKFNGQRNPIYISADSSRKVLFFGREEHPHENWEPTPSLVEQIRSLNFKPDLDYWLDSELYSSAKTKNP